MKTLNLKHSLFLSILGHLSLIAAMTFYLMNVYKPDKTIETNLAVIHTFFIPAHLLKMQAHLH